MKKIFYPILGCAALFGVGTSLVLAASGDVSNIASAPAKAAGDEGEYLRLGSVNDMTVTFNVTTGQVDFWATAPQSAFWMPSYDEISDADKASMKIDAIKIYRNEGNYTDQSTRVLVKEFSNVEWGAELEWSDDSELAHGKNYCYYAVGELQGHEGSGSISTVEVGYTIDAATDFAVTPGAQGALEATISFKAPTTCNGGAKTITNTIPKIEVLRKEASNWYADNEVIHTFTDLTPGAPYSYTDRDEALEAGEKYQYRLRLNYDGKDVLIYENSATVLLGPDKPEAPGNVATELLDNNGVKVTWTAPTKGQDGGWFDPSTLRYKVERGVPSGYSWSYTSLAENLDGLEYTDVIESEGSYRYRITAYAGEIAGGSAESSSFVAGPPSKMPLIESWPSANASNATWSADTGWRTSYRQVVYNSDYDEVCTISPSDNDGGFMLFTPNYSMQADDVKSLTTGRIDFTEAKNPIVKLDFYDIDPTYNDNDLKVYVSCDGGEYTALDDIDIMLLPGLNTWETLQASLKQFVGKAQYIQVQFRAVVGTSVKGYMAIDNVEVREIQPVDVAVKSVSAPKMFYPGAAMTVTANFTNTGDEDAQAFDFKVLLGETEIATSHCDAITKHGAAKVNVPVVIPADMTAGATRLQVVLTDVADADETNNSGSIDVETVALPVPHTLVADHESRTLTWSEPEALPFSDGNASVEENFIDIEHGSTEIDGWILIDGDGLDTYGIPAVGDYPHQGESGTGVVLDPAQVSNLGFSAAVDGGKIFVFQCAKGRSDDWLISPELSGAAQTLTFKYKSHSYGENFDVMTSTSGTATEDFTTLQTYKASDNYGANWDDVSIDLPEGTKYFAIHYYSYYGDALSVADFHFITGSAFTSEPTELKGYNVYCDGDKVNETPVTSTTYDLPDTGGFYTVKGIYTNAESAHSEGVQVEEKGASVDNIQADYTIGQDGLIIGQGVHYTVADLLGRIVAHGEGATRLNLPAGTYVVTIEGAGSSKIMIK